MSLVLLFFLKSRHRIWAKNEYIKRKRTHSLIPPSKPNGKLWNLL